tara:strand:+ start:783 stop:1034 length:252 start_codon:yes stop_codon:yes gene_type:complete
MTRGINSSFYKYRVVQTNMPPKYFKLISEIQNDYGIRKNTIYNIINQKRNISKSKKCLDIKIEKIKLPIRKNVEICNLELDKM